MNTLKILDTIKEGLLDSIPNITKEQIQLDSHLKNDLGIDSLSSMFFLTYLEDNINGFVVNADTIEARHFNTLQTIYDYVLFEMNLKASVSVSSS
ncbi:phosphopantetheine-binding protein [Aquimarina sp. D1M17]|uniref:acyl carrier protein n=1 Tax=Aquimarina acroporae TaxID=2937283 RepID=UPI0020BDC57E|nr:phosphopantetheine-binding protein [Aquimarina acroporae]MCK8520307.1 phosphopantetheine-binding protein [Aquimarina acroporae]